MGSIKNKTKKVLAAFLCLVLAMSLLPAGAMAIAGSPSTDGLELSKEVTSTPDADGVYWLTLEAYTTGDVTTSTSTKPTDIVLVLDQSGSMGDSFGSTKTKRQAAMKSAVTSFIDSVAGKYSATSNHSIGIVTFGSNATILKDMTYVDGTGKEALIKKVNDLPKSPEGATQVDLGMTEASDILPDADPGRDRIVIVFTDGVPTKKSAFNTTVANNAIEDAKTMKDAGVSVYTVGIFDDADANELFGTDCDGSVGSYWGSWGSDGDIPAANRFLNYLSSNYSAADIGLRRTVDHYFISKYVTYKITANYTGSNSGYYLTASNSAALKDVFDTISDTITTPTVSLTADSIVRDIIATPFELATDATHEITVSKVPYAGSDTWGSAVTATGITVTPDATTGKVDVTGFDFDANMVYDQAGTPAFGGTKLQIKIPIKLKSGATLPTGVSAGSVPTNSSGSCVIDADGNTVKAFPVPNVALYTVTFYDCNGTSVLSSAVVTPGSAMPSAPDASAAHPGAGYDFDGWNPAYDSSAVVNSDLSFTAQQVKDLTDTKTISYKVKYFKDGTEQTSDEGSGSDDIWVGDSSAPLSFDPDADKYTGYDLDTTATSIPASFSDGDVINVYYVKDPTDTKTISYTVKYFKDGTEQSSDEASGSANIWVGDSSAPLSFTPAADKYTGYDLDTTATSIPTSFSDGDVINVYYVKDLTDTKTISYTVKYFKDGVEQTSDEDSGSDDIWVGDSSASLSFTPAADKYTGYDLDTTATSIPASFSDGDVINVYYVKDPTDTKTISYTVKYFKDGTEQTSDEDSGSDDIWVGDSSAPLSFDPAADKYTGYDLDTTATSIPTAFSDGDVINVYYVKSSSDWFTVTFKAGANGTLDGSKDDVVIYEVLAGTAWDSSWVPTTAADSGYTLSSPAWDSTFPDNVTDNLVFTLQTKSSGGGGSVPADPAGDTDLELNKEDHIAYVVGYPDGTVRPQAPITRAEVATIFFRMLTDLSRESVWITTNSFSDVSEGDWYNNAISTLANAGVLSGYPDGTFKPNAPISRAEFATISTRFYDEVGSYATDAFSDISGHWAKDYINKAAELGLISGYNDGTFLPAKNITRAEAMSIMNNVLERSPDKDHLLDSMLTWSDNMDTEAWYYATVQEATNSHECELSEDGTHEIWTAVVAAPNWAELEEQWADSILGN